MNYTEYKQKKELIMKKAFAEEISPDETVEELIKLGLQYRGNKKLYIDENKKIKAWNPDTFEPIYETE